jgi:hypothetical protein
MTRFNRAKMERFCVLISKQDKAVSKRHGKARRTATPSGGFTKGSAIYAIYEKDVCGASKSNCYSVITPRIHGITREKKCLFLGSLKKSKNEGEIQYDRKQKQIRITRRKPYECTMGTL